MIYQTFWWKKNKWSASYPWHTSAINISWQFDWPFDLLHNWRKCYLLQINKLIDKYILRFGQIYFMVFDEYVVQFGIFWLIFLTRKIYFQNIVPLIFLRKMRRIIFPFRHLEDTPINGKSDGNIPRNPQSFDNISAIIWQFSSIIW